MSHISSKGASFERLTCKKLSLWVSGGARKDLFWRTAMSGGRATVFKHKQGQSGDVTAVEGAGHFLTDRFVIECKFNRTLELDTLVHEYGLLWRHWTKLIGDCEKAGKLPMLIGKENFRPPLVFMLANRPETRKLVECKIPWRGTFHHLEYVAVFTFKEIFESKRSQQWLEWLKERARGEV